MEKPPVNSPPQESAEQPNYQLLVGHHRTNGTWKSDEQLRTEYIRLTDNLVHDMVQGVQVEDPVTHERTVARPDVVIWLDKSARPISWLLKGCWQNDNGEEVPGLWNLLAADKDGNVPPMPAFRFVNIDRMQWVNAVDPHGEGTIDFDRFDPSIFRSLRSIFVEPKYKQSGLDESIDTAPSELDGKVVMIVDEVRASGRTLEYAKEFFKRAFPTSKVAGRHWMTGLVLKDVSAVGNADLPVWYKEKSMFGRGVGNREDAVSGKSRSDTQQLGRFFLSTRLPAVQLKNPVTQETEHKYDPLSATLRNEFRMLSREAYAGSLLVQPSGEREEQDYIERVERYNHMPFAEFQSRLQQQNEDSQKGPGNILLGLNPKIRR